VRKIVCHGGVKYSKMGLGGKINPRGPGSLGRGGEKIWFPTGAKKRRGATGETKKHPTNSVCTPKRKGKEKGKGSEKAWRAEGKGEMRKGGQSGAKERRRYRR